MPYEAKGANVSKRERRALLGAHPMESNLPNMSNKV